LFSTAKPFTRKQFSFSGYTLKLYSNAEFQNLSFFPRQDPGAPASREEKGKIGKGRRGTVEEGRRGRKKEERCIEEGREEERRNKVHFYLNTLSPEISGYTSLCGVSVI
jgi:hypothetical protein